MGFAGHGAKLDKIVLAEAVCVKSWVSWSYINTAVSVVRYIHNIAHKENLVGFPGR